MRGEGGKGYDLTVDNPHAMPPGKAQRLTD